MEVLTGEVAFVGDTDEALQVEAEINYLICNLSVVQLSF